MGVVGGVHGFSQNGRANAHAALAASLADAGVHVVWVGDAANGGQAGFFYRADLAAGQANQRARTIVRDDFCARACAAHQGAAAAWDQLDIVYGVARGHILNLHAVAFFGFGAGLADHAVVHFGALGRQDIALFAVSIKQ